MAHIGEVILPHALPPARVPPTTRVRGTVILGSLRGLRAHGQLDRYLASLPPEHRSTVEALTAGTWLPFDFAHAHYAACEALSLDRPTIEAIGAESGRFINETVLNVVAKLSVASGATPWMVLGYADTLRSRTWVGGSIAVTKLGPKDARLEWIQQPVARYPYFRTAFGAFVTSLCSLFATKVFFRELRERSRDTVTTYRFSWV